MAKFCIMPKSEKDYNFALVAAIIYAAIAAISIIRIVIAKIYDFGSITAIDVIYCIVLIGLAVTLFMKEKKAVIFAAGANVLLNAYKLIQFYDLYCIFNILAYTCFVINIIMAIKENPKVKQNWYLAVIMLIFGLMIRRGGDFSNVLTILTMFEAFALCFCGPWLAADIAPAAEGPVNEYASSTASSSDVIGGADILKIYKELLDSGDITQEEFDAKKKEILGL